MTTNEQPVNTEAAVEATTPEPQAQVAAVPETNEAPKVDVPEKFRKEDGSPDIEKILKANSELEKRFHSPEEVAKRKNIGGMLNQLSEPMMPAREPSGDIYSNPTEVIQTEVERATAPLKAEIVRSKMTAAAERAKSLPKFVEMEHEIAETISKDPGLHAMFRLGDETVFSKAHAIVLANKLSDFEKEAYERGKAEQISRSSSVPRVVSESTPAPEPTPVSKKQRMEELRRGGGRIENILMDDAILTDSERRLFGKV